MENPFGEFEDDFKKTEKAAPGTMPGRVPPETYKFVLTTNDPKGDGILVDHEIVVGNEKGTKGLKIFCQIFSPETVVNPKTKEPEKTKGVIIGHVFWVTKDTLPYILRDISTIIGRDLKSMGETVNLTWAGRTFEGVVIDDEYKSRVNSRISYINPWTPSKEGDEKKQASQKKTAEASPTGGPGIKF